VRLTGRLSSCGLGLLALPGVPLFVGAGSALGSGRERFGRATVMTALALAIALTGSAAASGKRGDGAPEIRILSTRADLVSGGDALVEVIAPARTDTDQLRVWVNDREVTSSFKRRSGGRLLGLVDGLRPGRNELVARVSGPGPVATLTVTDHDVQGPLFAGRQVQPWICTTETNGLGPATDGSCSAPTRYQFFYKSSTTGDLEPYDPASPPADVAETTTDQGHTVPYIVRRERGVIDRGIYDIAVLFDPTRPWDPTAPQEGWNGKVLWPFGGDCQPNHVQPAPVSALDDQALSRGFAVASNGLNVLGADCNDVVSAEAVTMVKEQLIERYGPVRYTIGKGCSGGSMQQHWIAANYPGLLDGIQPTCSFPDIWDTLQEAEDCSLLNRRFQAAPGEWADTADQTAVSGHGYRSVCLAWAPPADDSFGGYARIWLDPDNGPACLRHGTSGESPPWVYNAQTNPSGVRCTLQDYQVAQFGTRPQDGFANTPFDNVGVQYGLQALQSGAISPEQFVDINANAGGYDIDWNWQPQRSQADAAALANAYRGGRITYGRQLAEVPIIDLRGTGNAGIHSDVHSYITRARLDAANGHHTNQVIWTTGGPITGEPSVAAESFLLIDQWLAAIESDHSHAPLQLKVLRDKPAAAVDACWIAGRKVTDRAQCDHAYPHYALPRIAAGAPLANDVLKCQLKPLRRSDYAVTFTDDEWQRLQAAFPTGVCDYTRPGVAQRPSLPWLTYERAPGGDPLGPPPTSRPGVAPTGADRRASTRPS
jgi:hypothetical protein